MTIKFTILGCGSSMGVPHIDGSWGKCDPREKKNLRSRCCALITTKSSQTLIDTSPDLRGQLVKAKIKKIDRVIYSHMHADQTHGINELRVFYLNKKKKIEIFADLKTRKYLLDSFSYCFKENADYPATLNLNKVKKVLIFGKKESKIKIKCIPVKHGSINALSFIINNKLAYASDVSHIFSKDMKYFHKLEYLVIDCLRLNKHSSHYCLKEILEIVKIINPKKTVLTNMHSDLDYNYLLNILPNNVIPAYDNLTLNI